MVPRSLCAVVAWKPLVVAGQHPELSFGVGGGAFARLIFMVGPVQRLLAGRGIFLPSGQLWKLVVEGVIGRYLLAWMLWWQLGAERSPRRGASVGALSGLLALPVPFFVIELFVIAFSGIPFEPIPGASLLIQFPP